MNGSPDWTGALDRARAYSPFLTRALGRLPDIAALLAAGDGEGALAMAAHAGDGAPDVPTALRRQRLAMALTLGIGDLAGAFPLARVVGELSALADHALDAAIAHAIRARVPDAAPAGFVALALGKQGAGELNYSSDIDPILLFDPDTLPRRPRDEPAEAAQIYARQIVKTMGHVDAEGYVFRIDLRLRPASEVSPLAIPIEAAMSHYESSALAWERAAFIRARACSGDIALGEGFLAHIRPFVWRKSLDFGAIAEIGRLTRRIRAEYGKVGAPGPGYDVKRARGGIREVEFFAQTHQLIHGGRNPALRQKGTRAALDALAAAGIIDAGDATMLGDSYDRLRVIEHRLQMVSDLQTHTLPPTAEGIEVIARLDGMANGAALIEELTAITERVGALYDGLIEESAPCVPGASAPPQGLAMEAELAALNYPDPAGLAARIDGWRGGTIRALRSDAALAAWDAIRPQVLAALAGAADPLAAINRWERLITALPTAINLFRLLEARPGLLAILARILTLAPPLADQLTRRADLLDTLIDASAFNLPGPVEALIEEFSAGEADDDYQAVLDRVRRRVGEKRFALGVQLIEGAHDPLAIAGALAQVAQAALQVLADAAVAEFESVHGRIAGGELVILGLGRLGGEALTHASDLDIIYLFTGDFAAESDGRRPLGATLYFNRLAQRVSAALSVPTAEGALYEVDTRLRPQGTQGPLAATVDSFERYQREEAWVWEHMALERARVMYGSPAARAQVEAIIHATLTTPRDRAKVLAEVIEMRARMAEHKPAKGALDVKLMRGGLVDVEFIVHALQLTTGKGMNQRLSKAIAALVRDGLLPPAMVEAHGVLGRVLVASRLLAPDALVPGPAPCAVLAKACDLRDWEQVEQALGEARRVVAQSWQALFGQALEVD